MAELSEFHDSYYAIQDIAWQSHFPRNEFQLFPLFQEYNSVLRLVPMRLAKLKFSTLKAVYKYI